MTEGAARFVTLLGVLALLIGVYLGFSRITVAAINGTQDCGSAFGGGDYQTAGAFIVAECDTKLHDRRVLAWILIGAGGVVGYYGWSQSAVARADAVFQARKRAEAESDAAQ